MLEPEPKSNLVLGLGLGDPSVRAFRLCYTRVLGLLAKFGFRLLWKSLHISLGSSFIIGHIQHGAISTHRRIPPYQGASYSLGITFTDTAILSIAHSFTPLRIRKKPFSPHESPQLFFTIQYFSPLLESTPYPTKRTAWLVA